MLSIDHFSKGSNLPLSFSSSSFILKHSSSKRKVLRKLQLGAGIALQRPKPRDPDCAEKCCSYEENSQLAVVQMELSLQIALEVKWNRSFNFSFHCTGKAALPYSLLPGGF